MRNLALVLVVACSALISGAHPAAAQPPGPLVIAVGAERLELPEGHALVYDFTVTNLADKAVVFLPQVLRLRVEGQGARPVERPPATGPKAVPWFGARVLAPGEAFPYHAVGLADRAREWHLPPGQYEVSLEYEPGEQSFQGYEGAEGTRWVGAVRSAPLAIQVTPKPTPRPHIGGDPGRVEGPPPTPPPPTDEELRERLVEDILAGRQRKEIGARLAEGDPMATDAALVALSRASGATQLDRAAGLLHRSPDRDRVVEAMVERLQSGGDERVGLVLNHLRAYAAPEVTDALIGLLRDPSAEVSRAASAALAGSQESAVRGALWKLVDDPSAPGSAWAVLPLAQCLDPDAEAMIVNQFVRRDLLYQEQALHAMGLYGSPRILAWLVDVAKNHAEAEIRDQALDALQAYAFRQPQCR